MWLAVALARQSDVHAERVFTLAAYALFEKMMPRRVFTALNFPRYMPILSPHLRRRIADSVVFSPPRHLPFSVSYALTHARAHIRCSPCYLRHYGSAGRGEVTSF